VGTVGCPPDLETVLTAYADTVVKLEERVRDVEGERDVYRELLCAALAKCHRLLALVRVQRRNLNDRTRNREHTYAQELCDIDAWIDSKTAE
jgi:hypothetical protein